MAPMPVNFKNSLRFISITLPLSTFAPFASIICYEDNCMVGYETMFMPGGDSCARSRRLSRP